MFRQTFEKQFEIFVPKCSFRNLLAVDFVDWIQLALWNGIKFQDIWYLSNFLMQKTVRKIYFVKDYLFTSLPLQMLTMLYNW